MSAEYPFSAQVNPRRPLSTFQSAQQQQQQQQKLQQPEFQRPFHSVIDPSYSLLNNVPTVASSSVTPVPVAPPEIAGSKILAVDEAAAFVAAESVAANAELSPPDSQLDSRSFDSLTGQLDGDIDEVEGEVTCGVDNATECAKSEGKATAAEVIEPLQSMTGGGGGASSDEGLISGEDDEEREEVDDTGGAMLDERDQGSAATSAGAPAAGVSRGTFRKKFEASLRRKEAAESAEQSRRRCASVAAAVAATTASFDDGNAAASGGGGGVALRHSEAVRDRIESCVARVSISGGAGETSAPVAASRTPSIVRTDPNWKPALRSMLSTGSSGVAVGAAPAASSASPASAATLPPQSTSAGWRNEGGVFLFGEPSMSLGFLAGGAGVSEQPARLARPEISLPVGHIQETRKEGSVRLTRLSPPVTSGTKSQQSSGGGSKKSTSAQPQPYRLLLTGPDLVFYRADKKSSDKKPEFALNVAATEILPPPASTSPSTSPSSFADLADSETDMRLRYPAVGRADQLSDDSLSRYAHLYPSFPSTGQQQQHCCDLLLHWDDPKQRKEWSVALRYAKDLLMQRMYSKAAGPPIDWGARRVSIAQRLNDFFRRRPALNELVDRGIVRNEPVFGSTLRLICQHERTDVPNFLRRCLLAIESHGLDTEGIYRLAGNAATVQKLRLMVDQQENYDLTVGWDVHVLTSALKTFLRELKEPMIPSDTFQVISDHFKSTEKPSVKREAIRQALRSLPPNHYASLRLLCEHLGRVVSQSEQSQMNSRNLALMFGPNLVLPDAAGGNLCPTSNLMYQNHVVEYVLLESERLFAD